MTESLQDVGGVCEGAADERKCSAAALRHSRIALDSVCVRVCGGDKPHKQQTEATLFLSFTCSLSRRYRQQGAKC